MNRALPLGIILTLLLLQAPSANATWSSSTLVPAAFRPNRTVAFTYAVTSDSGTDLPLEWMIRLKTCQDANRNGYCEAAEPGYVDHGEKRLTLLAGQDGSVTWSVSLDQPEGAYQYHFHTRCSNSPCTSEPAGGDHNRTGPFELRYTDTWTRTIDTIDPTTAGTTQWVTYQLSSTSQDDRDLAGIAELFSCPPDASSESQGAQPYAAPANAQTILQWESTSFPTIGTHQLRVTDSGAPDTVRDVSVQGVHLHVIQPRQTYEAGARFSLYFTLEGHGATTEPQKISDAPIDLTIRNGSHVVHAMTLLTDVDGHAYADYATAADATTLNWTAQATGTWQGAPFDLLQEGQVAVVAPHDEELAENVSTIRHDLDELQLKGIHLDELGSRHLFLTSVRAAGAVILVVLLFLFVVYVAIRV